MNRCSAYLRALGRSGAVAALARMRGSWCQRLNWRSSRSCGVAGQAGEAAVHPAFVVGELPVGGRQGAAADQEVTQVDGGVPVGAGGQGLVGEREAAGDEVGEQAADVGPGEPAGGRRRVGGGGQGLGERPQGGGEWPVLPKISVMAWVTAQGWQSRPRARLPS